MNTRLISAIVAGAALAAAATVARADQPVTSVTVSINSGAATIGKMTEGSTTTVYTISPTGIDSVSQSPPAGTAGAAQPVRSTVTGFPIAVQVGCSAQAANSCSGTFTVTVSGLPNTNNPKVTTTSFTVGPTTNLTAVSPAAGTAIANGGTFTFKFLTPGSQGKSGSGSFNLGTVVSLVGSSGTGTAQWTITVNASTPG